MVTLTGRAGDHPPADEAGFLAFARSFPVEDVHRCLAAAEPLSPVVLHRFPASVWRRYERMPRWPEGFLVVGDAVCAFNPVYGQGMAVAALDALALERALRRDEVGADLRFAATAGPRPVGFGLTSRYMGALLELSGEEPAVARRFLEVIALRRPPAALFAPAVAGRMLRRALRGR